MDQQVSTGAAPAGAMRPLAVGEVLDAAITVVKRNFKTLAIIVLVVGLPVAVVSVLIDTSTTEPCQGAFCGDADVVYQDAAAYNAGLVAEALLAVLRALVVGIACFQVVAAAYLGRDATVRSSLGLALRRTFSVLWISLIYAVVVGLMSLTVVGWVFIAVIWSLALPVLLVEDRRGFKALGRSAHLVQGRFWGTFSILLLALIITFVPQTLVAGNLEVLLLTDVFDAGSVAQISVTAGLGLALSVFTSPFLGAVIAMTYFDLRVRREGLDLMLLAERMGGAPSTVSLTKALPAAPASLAPPAPAAPEPWR